MSLTSPAPAPPLTPRRSPTRTVGGLLLIGAGSAWLLDSTGVLTIPWAVVGAVALMVVGLGLIAGAHGGHQRGLTLVGLVLVAGLLASSSVDYRLGGRFGDERVTIRSPAELAHRYRVAVGDLTLDLTGVEIRDGLRLDAATGLGDVLVIVRRDIALSIHARAGAGDITVPGRQQRDGINLDERFRVAGASPSSPRLALDLSVGAGSIRVQRRG